MSKATAIVRKAAVKQDRVVDRVTLDHLARQSPGARLTADGGLSIAVALPGDPQLNDGDALKLEDGQLVVVKAADEQLLEVRAENPLRLMRVLWHLGQSHAAVEVTADAIYVARDDATAELVRGQGCSLTPIERPFRPERPIAGHDCGHHHGHGHHGHDHHGHDHGHTHHDHAHHDHAHAHAEAHAEADAHAHTEKKAHDHGACGCGHDHGHDHADDHGHAHDHAHAPTHDDHHGHDHAGHGHRHHSHAHHGHDHGKDGH